MIKQDRTQRHLVEEPSKIEHGRSLIIDRFSNFEFKDKPMVKPATYHITGQEPDKIHDIDRNNLVNYLVGSDIDRSPNSTLYTPGGNELSKSNKPYLTNRLNSEQWSSSNNHYRPLENNNNFFVERKSSNNDIKIEIGEHEFSANGYLVLSIILGVIIIGLLATRK